MRRQVMIVLSAGLVACGSGVPQMPSPRDSGMQPKLCSVNAQTPEVLTLDDGATATVNASSIATFQGSLAIVGSPTLVWRAGATPRDMPMTERTSLGVVRDSRGVARLIPLPPGHTEVQHPRVASAGAHGWHVLFVTGKQGTPTNVLLFGTADLWYGRFDGVQWQEVQRIGTAQYANLTPEGSSELVASDASLAFTYSYDHAGAAAPRTGQAQRGLVMVRRGASGWIADSLPTWEGPWSVQLIATRDRALLAVYAQSFFSDGRPHGPALFTARYESRWGEPRLLLDNSPQYVSAPMARSSGHDVVISWQKATRGADPEVLEWGIARSDSEFRRVGPISSVTPPDRPAIVQLPDGRIAWFVRNGDARDELRVFVAASDTLIADVGGVRVPLDNLVTVATPLSDGRVMLVTGGLGTSETGPPAKTYLTVLAIRCTDGRK